MAKIINGSSLALALANYICTNAYLNDTAQDVLIMVGNWIDEAQEITVPTWIPVSERLPRPNKLVLCWWESGNGEKEHYGFATFQSHGVWYVSNEGMPKVTHWMPLPEPPIKENT